MDEGGQIWLKCITGDLIMMIRDKNDIFERVENCHVDLAWNYPTVVKVRNTLCIWARLILSSLVSLKNVKAPRAAPLRSVKGGVKKLFFLLSVKKLRPPPFLTTSDFFLIRFFFYLAQTTPPPFRRKMVKKKPLS